MGTRVPLDMPCYVYWLCLMHFTVLIADAWIGRVPNKIFHHMPFQPTLSYIRPVQLNQKSKMKLTNIIQKRKHHSKFKKSVPDEDLLLAELTTNEANPRNFLGTRGTFWSKRSSDSLPFSSIIRTSRPKTKRPFSSIIRWPDV